MSVIFPTEPAPVHIHLLPKDVGMVSYEVSDTLKFSAWMPDGFHKIHQETTMGCDRFYDTYCSRCYVNSPNYLDDYTDEYGDVDWEHDDLHEYCGVFNDGYSGQYCPVGNARSRGPVEFHVSDMVFVVSLNYLGPPPRFVVFSDSAFLQKGMLNSSGEIVANHMLMAANVFGTEEGPEGICWGYNSKPQNLREIVYQYFSTPFNNDLTSIDTFAENCERIRGDGLYHRAYVSPKEKYFCGNADAIMLLDAENNIQAFYTMLMAGFKPLPEAMHVIAIPLFEKEIERGGNVYSGFITTEDAVGKPWFISPTANFSDGLLVGQL